MSKFKEGDSVRLKRGLVVDNVYGDLSFVDQMVFNGCRSIVSIDNENGWMRLEDFNRYRYTYEMLEPAEKIHYSSLACRHKFSPIKFSKP